MKTRMVMIPALIAALFGVQTVLAQPAPAKTREQVKAECAEARKAGKILEGECLLDTGKAAAPQAAGGKTRAQVKAECEAARKAGKVVEGECQYEMPAKAKSATTRADVKLDCAAARKAGKVMEGECPQ